jgi:hypothetical protein
VRADLSQAVARTLLTWARAGTHFSGVTLRRVEANGQPGALVLDPAGKPFGVVALDVVGGQIEPLTPSLTRQAGPPGLPVAA